MVSTGRRRTHPAAWRTRVPCPAIAIRVKGHYQTQAPVLDRQTRLPGAISLQFTKDPP
ncbi:hypothetical protein SBRY_50401 [Actinacidiphila bryophytorum]|uniref:Uncharacterized protein n=1 Tax=Actinacidiphila bryophytorum TaxID=1436133 RepID=A0A9W4H4W6_9ACTN|nr:hypothetical protein SBRY_50401 [Actinacidiphila bryophytorum]